MTCLIQKNINKLKLLNYDVKDVCNIKKFIVKWGENENETKCYFDIIKQSELFQTVYIYGDENQDNLNILYTFIKTSFFSDISDVNFFNDYIFKNSPVLFMNDTPYSFNLDYINNTIIIREIFRLCNFFSLKLWIEIEVKDGLLIYKDI